MPTHLTVPKVQVHHFLVLGCLLLLVISPVIFAQEAWRAPGVFIASSVCKMGGADVNGVWDAEIVGIQQRTGDPQRDTAILSLRQSGSTVTGTMTYAGVSEGASLSGTVSGQTVTFTAVMGVDSSCAVQVEVSAKVPSSKTRMRGTYSAVTCEDTVRGILTASKRQH